MTRRHKIEKNPKLSWSQLQTRLPRFRGLFKEENPPLRVRIRHDVDAIFTSWLSSDYGSQLDRNPSSSEGLDPTLPISSDWRATSAVLSTPTSSSPPDILLLYWTLVADGTVLPGYQRQFLELETGIKQAADRTNRRFSQEDNMSAAVWLHRESEAEKTRTTKQAVDQFMLASLDRPARFKCRWQQQFFEGRAARRDAEENLRKKWLGTLEGLLRGTKTPMGERQVSSAPGSVPLGAGRRGSTLRSQVRVTKRYLTWLALAHETAFPREVHQMTVYLQARHSEPCCRGALKNTHNAPTFLEEAAAVEDRLTRRALYGTVYKELLATAIPWRAPR